MPKSQLYRRVYDALFSAYGPRGWWPADTPFEMMVGAILTQNTAWANVEKAIIRLRDDAARHDSADGGRGVIEPQRLLEMTDGERVECIRPAGFFRQKSARLAALCEWFARYGFDIGRVRPADPAALRRELLAISGVGPETSDCIVLYAARQPSFVVDAYT